MKLVRGKAGIYTQQVSMQSLRTENKILSHTCTRAIGTAPGAIRTWQKLLQTREWV